MRIKRSAAQILLGVLRPSLHAYRWASISQHVVGTSKTAPLQWAQQVTQLPQSGLGGTISLDGMIMAVMEQDAILLVQASSKFFAVDDGWWFACHMADLLVVSGLRLSSRTADLREVGLQPPPPTSRNRAREHVTESRE